MARRPEFTIVAGPNGAGKSRLCQFYIHTPSFDGDKLMLMLRKEHSDWPDRWIIGSVAGELDKQKTMALECKTDFAFETNFSNEMAVRMVRDFKDAGFKTSLCYFGLYSESDSISRVMLRVQTGGHDVDNEVVRFNFTEGIRNARQNLHLFDNITFVDGNSEELLNHVNNSNVHVTPEEKEFWNNKERTFISANNPENLVLTKQ